MKAHFSDSLRIHRYNLKKTLDSVLKKTHLAGNF
jgi:hypothetical protein